MSNRLFMKRAYVCFFPLTRYFTLSDLSVMRTQNGRASSFDSSLRKRLLNPFGPDVLLIGSDCRTDSTSYEANNCFNQPLCSTTTYISTRKAFS